MFGNIWLVFHSGKSKGPQRISSSVVGSLFSNSQTDEVCLAFLSFQPWQWRHHQDLIPSLLFTTMFLELSDVEGGGFSTRSGFLPLNSRRREDVARSPAAMACCLRSFDLFSPFCVLLDFVSLLQLLMLLSSSSRSLLSPPLFFSLVCLVAFLLGESSYFLLVSSLGSNLSLVSLLYSVFLGVLLVLWDSLLSLRGSHLSGWGLVVVGSEVTVVWPYSLQSVDGNVVNGLPM